MPVVLSSNGIDARLAIFRLVIGSGFIDPETQVTTHGENAYFLGLINQKQKTRIEKLQLEVVRLTKRHEWKLATYSRAKMLNLLQNMTGLATLYDFRRVAPYQTSKVTDFLSNVENKKVLKANESIVYQECSGIVGAILNDDLMKSVRFMMEYLIAKKVKVLIYSGQCDLRVSVMGTEAWIKKMKWKGVVDHLESKRKIWLVNGRVAGYVQKWRNFVNVVVFGAGHLVPADQSKNSQAMIEDWVLENGLFGNQDIVDFDGLTNISVESQL